MNYEEMNLAKVEEFPSIDGKRRLLCTYENDRGYRFPRIQLVEEAA